MDSKLLEEEIIKLSRAFTPEWKFTRDNPDMGSVIAMIYAEHTGDTIDRYLKAKERYREELLKILELKPVPAQASEAVITICPGQVPGGVNIPPKTRFWAKDEEGEESIIFETEHPIHVTDSKLTAVAAISQKAGNVNMVRDETGEGLIYPVDFFPDRMEGSYTNEFHIRHPYIFNGSSGEVLIELSGERRPKGQEMAVFSAKRKPGMQEIVWSRDAGKPAGEWWKDLSLSYECKDAAPDFIFNGYRQLDEDRVLPFGEEITVYSECWFGQEEVFRIGGADIVMSFTLETECERYGDRIREKGKLKVIKRAPRPETVPIAAEVYAEEIRLEYYNGQGFKRIKTSEDIRGIFHRDGSRQVRIEFQCPGDWKPLDMDGRNVRLLRIQVIKADGCYMRPAVHHYPVMTDIRFSCFYRAGPGKGMRIYRKLGSRVTEITEELKNHKSFCLFPDFPYTGEQMLLGFDKKFQNGPVSIYLIIQERKEAPKVQVRFEYLGPEGFKPLAVEDYTNGFSGPGTLIFMPPHDMETGEVEGVCAYWIRIIREGEPGQENGRRVNGIYLNGVQAVNRDRSPVQEYFLDTVKPDMIFPAEGENILDVGVIASEKDGRLTEWKETESFTDSSPGDCHYLLDRKKGRIQFGDGKSGKIPGCTDGLTFSLEVRRCKGEEGNVRGGAIEGPVSYIQGIEGVTNPLPASGGWNQEPEENLYRRAELVFKNGNLLVSEKDYIEEILAFSGQISEVFLKLEEGKMKIYILMKDMYRDRKSVQVLFGKLKQHLLTKCQPQYNRGNMEIMEPVFIRLSLDIWIQPAQGCMSFQNSRRILDGIHDIFSPFRAGKEKKAIGSIPDEGQIREQVKKLSFPHKVASMGILASYEDGEGYHETGLSFIPRGLPAVCISGEHHIHPGIAPGSSAGAWPGK